MNMEFIFRLGNGKKIYTIMMTLVLGLACTGSTNNSGSGSSATSGLGGRLRNLAIKVFRHGEMSAKFVSGANIACVTSRRERIKWKRGQLHFLPSSSSSSQSTWCTSTIHQFACWFLIIMQAERTTALIQSTFFLVCWFVRSISLDKKKKKCLEDRPCPVLSHCESDSRLAAAAR